MTKTERQQILDDHIDEHNGFDPVHFAELATDPEHPAHAAIYPEGWEKKAQRSYLTNRVIMFVGGLRYTIRIETREVAEEVEVPAVAANLTEKPGTGRYLVASDVDYMDALRDQARRHMLTALDRYGAVLTKTDREALGRMIRRWE